jgi:hypothetical protein
VQRKRIFIEGLLAVAVWRAIGSRDSRVTWSERCGEKVLRSGAVGTSGVWYLSIDQSIDQKDCDCGCGKCGLVGGIGGYEV